MEKQQIINEILNLKLHIDVRGNLYGERYKDHLSLDTGCWQLPEELAGLLMFLQDKKDIKSFLNIGTFNGVTFNYMADFLNKDKQVECITIDPFDFKPFKNKNYQYLSCTSKNFIDKKFDLVFIDGHHSYPFVKEDYENVGKNAKYVIFHDIEDKFIKNEKGYEGGVPRLWNELKDTRKSIEFIDADKPEKIMGIGLLYEE